MCLFMAIANKIFRIDKNPVFSKLIGNTTKCSRMTDTNMAILLQLSAKSAF